MWSGIVANCYDSHVHLLGTGKQKRILLLNHLKSPREVSELKIQSQFFLGDWLIGYGWDHTLWNEGQFPSRFDLDKVFSNYPVCFTRVDGHAMWVNTEALKRAQLFSQKIMVNSIQGGLIECDREGWPTGILVDNAMDLVTRLLPPPSRELVRADVIEGMRVFNSNGFTHIRDMTGISEQWEESVALDKELTLAIEQYFGFENQKEFSQVLKRYQEAQNEKLFNIKLRGFKTYYDGALGSEGAYLSHNYASKDSKGLRLWEPFELREILKTVWNLKAELAIHAIGDQAIHEIIEQIVFLKQEGCVGAVAIEHAEIVRPETIELMKDLNIKCYMQPCHWLSDKKWLQQKLGSLFKNIFPWAQLEAAGIPIFWGSDSPIERSSFKNTFLALQDSQAYGVKMVREPFWKYHSHPDEAWTPKTHTVFSNGEVKEVFFRGEKI